MNTTPRRPAMLSPLCRTRSSTSPRSRLIAGLVGATFLAVAIPGHTQTVAENAHTPTRDAPSDARLGNNSRPPSDDDEAWSVRYHVGEAQRLALEQRLGEATLHLERARYLRPFDLELRRGLDLLRQEVQRARMERFVQGRMTQGEPSDLWWWRLFHVLPSRVWAGGALVWMWAACALWMLRRRMRSSVPRDAVSVSGVLSALLCVVFTLCWVGTIRTSSDLEPGVIVVKNPRYFHAPDELASTMISPDLYEGAVVLIRGRQQDWSEVELANGERVWVHSHAVRGIALCTTP